jgi:hypothetical protein
MLNQCNEFALRMFMFFYNYLPLWLMAAGALGSAVILINVIKECKKRWGEK